MTTSNHTSSDPTSEEWRDIPGYEDVYQVSDLGGVRNRHNRIMVARLKNSGYLFITCYSHGVRQNFYVHSLVAMLFVGERPPRHDVNHIDGNKLNNACSNLEYVTRTENMKHARQTGLHDNRGELQWNHKLTENDVRDILWIYGCVGEVDVLPEIFGVSKRTILDVLEQKTWRHVS